MNTGTRRQIAVRYAIALAITLAAIVYAGVVPVEPSPPNDVRWLDPGPGLRFDGRGIAYSDEVLAWEASPEGGEISVELWLRAAEEPTGRQGQIFAFFDREKVEPLRIAQWKSGLVIRNRLLEREGGRPYRELGSLGMLFRDQPRGVALTSDSGGTTLYLDGLESGQRSNIPIIAPGEAFWGRLVLGNSASGTSPWHGDLFGVAVYRRALGADEVAAHHVTVNARGVAALARTPGLVALYPFDGRSGESASSGATVGPSLQVPVDFRRLRLPILQLPDLRGRSVDAYGRDALVNVIGFAPLGFFAMALFRFRDREVVLSQVLFVVTFGFILSLVIEIAQVQLPARVSSATDLMWNTIGTALGAWLAARGPLAARIGDFGNASGGRP